MQQIHESIFIKTNSYLDIIDITPTIIDWVRDKQIKSGLINIFIAHTSASLFINEYEPGIASDIKNKLNQFNPDHLVYEHNKSHVIKNESCFNGHSHLNALFLPTSITLQVINGSIQLGTWQKLLLIELDHAKQRQINIFFQGE